MIKPLHNIIKYYPKVTVTLIALLLCNPLDAATSILRDKVTNTGIKIELGVDLNRDGEITFDSYTDGKLNPNDDKTSPQRPFRFWLNNDFDAVSFKGDAKLDRKTCDTRDGGADIKVSGIQVCEQDDFTSGSNTATPEIIEAVRDLEDFTPLAIKISPWNSSLKNINIKLRGNGFGIINLFKGQWIDPTEATAYLKKANIAIEQVKNENYMGSLFGQTIANGANTDGDNSFNFKVNANNLQVDNENNAIAKFIFEGSVGQIVDITDCTQTPEQCYLELIVEDSNNNIIASKKLYFQLYDIKAFYDHYTVGNYYHGPGSTHPNNDEFMSGEQIVIPDSPSNIDSYKQDIITTKTAAAQEQQNKNYILLVHGWRMQPAERITFAETTFKRLYWSGYKGRFGLFSWPTSWFYKPAHLSELQALIQSGAGDDPQSYDRGEAAARRTGLRLVNLLEALNVIHSGGVRVLAHSMGNVVVSEALKAYQGSNKIISHYVASQAATVGSAYQPSAGDSQVRTPIIGTINNFQEAWEFNNTSDTDFPTYRYQYARLRTDSTDPDNLSKEFYTVYPDLENDSDINIQAYYSDIVNKVGSIINFHNVEDAALDAWRFNAATKPDGGSIGPGGEWTFDRRERKVENGVAIDCNTDPCDYYFDQYYFDRNVLTNPVEVNYTNFGNENINLLGRPDILAYITPGRSNPLGVGAFAGSDSVIPEGNSVNMNRNGPNGSVFGLTDSNYDHSAQFLSDYYSRQCYWENLLIKFGFPIQSLNGCDIN